MSGARIVQLKAAQDAIEARAIAIPDAGPSQEWAVDLLVKRLQGRFLYDISRGEWLRFDGAGWTATGEGQADVYGAIHREAVDLLEHIATRLNELHPSESKNPPPGPRWQTVKVRDSIIAGAQKLPAMRVEGFRIWDREPHMLATPDGLVDLKTGATRKASPADMVRQRTRVAPDEGKPARWLKFLTETFGHDAEVLTYVQRIAGYWLTGDTEVHAFWCLVGGGGNGKSVFVDALSWAMGDYATASAVETWCTRAHDPHREELARLDGKRLIVSAEPESPGLGTPVKRLNESRVKAWASADEVTANFMRQNSFQFKPVGKLVMLGQSVPAIGSTDPGWRRRLRVLPFSRTPAEVDLHLSETLKGEAGRILRWAIEGARLYYDQGIPSCGIVADASAGHMNDHDEFGSWLAECCKEAKGVVTPSMRLCDSFNAWLRTNEGYDGPKVGPRAFKHKLRQVGYHIERKGGADKVHGLGLK
jgi:putative DNA primase/helicase